VELTSDAYRVVKALHLVTVIAGFGALALTPVWVGRARAAGSAGGAAVAAAGLQVARLAEWLLYAAGILGVLAVLVSDDVWQFSQAWISAAFVLYVAAIGVFHGMKLPALRRIAALLDPGSARPAPADLAREVEAAERKAAVATAIFDVVMVVAVVVMVWKPGA